VQTEIDQDYKDYGRVSDEPRENWRRSYTTTSVWSLVRKQAASLKVGVEWLLVVAFTNRLGTLDIQIHDNRVLPASDDHGFTRHI
jgi:hypothetical protein